MTKSLQETYGPEGVCFGCGPKNEKGLQIKSFKEGDKFVLDFETEDHHKAFGEIINGGIIGALFDCHGNWTAAKTLFDLHPDKEFPSTVTSTFTVNLHRPTPADKQLHIVARVSEIRENFVDVEMEMLTEVKGEIKVTSSATATYVSVPDSHPAYHRWQ